MRAAVSASKAVTEKPNSGSKSDKADLVSGRGGDCGRGLGWLVGWIGVGAALGIFDGWCVVGWGIDAIDDCGIGSW